MKKKIFVFICLLFTVPLFCQVGIGTDDPQSTLQVVGKPATSTVLDGIIPPKLTGDELFAKTYTSSQTGAVVYVTTAASTANLTGQTIDVNEAGLYFFNGVKWVAAKTSEVTGESSPVKLSLYAQATDTQPVTGGTTDNFITFQSTDLVVSTSDVSLDTSGSYSFTINTSGIYKISSFTFLQPNSSSNASNFYGANIKVDLSTDSGSTWNSIGGSRTIWTGRGNISTSLVLPTVVASLTAGNKIRVTITRSTSDTTAWSGANLNAPTGLSYSKTIEITKLK